MPGSAPLWAALVILQDPQFPGWNHVLRDLYAFLAP
jgi:hypothetical protein